MTRTVELDDGQIAELVEALHRLVEALHESLSDKPPPRLHVIVPASGSDADSR